MDLISLDFPLWKRKYKCETSGYVIRVCYEWSALAARSRGLKLLTLEDEDVSDDGDVSHRFLKSQDETESR